MTTQAIAEALHRRIGSPVLDCESRMDRALGICFAVAQEMLDMLTRAIEQAQAHQRHGELLTIPAPVLARQLLAETVSPGSTRDHDCPEVW
jgi:hypothetical protein